MEVELTRQEANMRYLIATGDMSPHRAASFLNELDRTKPWYSKVEYIQGIAAVAALFDKEMSRKTYQQGRDIRSILLSPMHSRKVRLVLEQHDHSAQDESGKGGFDGQWDSPERIIAPRSQHLVPKLPRPLPHNIGAAARCWVPGEATGAQCSYVQPHHSPDEAP